MKRIQFLLQIFLGLVPYSGHTVDSFFNTPRDDDGSIGSARMVPKADPSCWLQAESQAGSSRRSSIQQNQDLTEDTVS